MPKAFLVLVTMVVLVSLFFGLVIWRQTVKFEKKAAVLKEKKEQYLQELEEQESRHDEQDIQRTEG